MVRAKFNYPDLDVLDSPLMSPTPLTSVGGIPGSAIAERIFNDPDSWEENDDTDVPKDSPHDPLAWLVDEIEKFRANSADVYGAFVDPVAYGKRKPGLMTPPAGGEFGTGLKGIGRTNIRPISITSFIEPQDIQAQLSKILDSGGISYQVHPLSSAISPPSASSSSSVYTPVQIHSASTVASSTEDGPSPVAIYSASTTMSFLEWYGIFTDSPLNSRSMIQRRKPVKSKIPALKAPTPRRTIRSSSLVSPIPSKDTFSRPPEKRVSSVPPPGLEPPTCLPLSLPRSQSPAPTPSQPPVPSNPTRVLSASPPPYTRTSSPAGSRSNSNPSSRSSSNSRSQPHTGTPVQGVSDSDLNGTTRRSRLPSIPPDPNARSMPSLQVQVHSPVPVVSRLASSPLRSSTAPPSSNLTGTFMSPELTSQLSESRPLSAVRSPLVRPAGPRARASQSLMSHHRSSTQGAYFVHHRSGFDLPSQA
ncbi:hypothetical protein BYT27DRAFT_7194933 [Phlegmacium glaucopus]|nr:hypothetical protein BYT27DRAFT_7194933 [Phlegmacium glaucopus]